MPKRARKFVGAVAMLGFVCLYGVLAMLVAQTDQVRHAHPVLQGIFFLVVGMAWILPIMPLIKWMERDDPVEPSAP